MIDLIRRIGLPLPRTNVRVLGYEVDFLWPEVWLNVEVDGAQHNTPPARRADAARDRILGAAGYTVLRFPEHLVKERPDEVLRAVSAWVASRGLQRAA
jgi:very-short-patch-repair endonuclease